MVLFERDLILFLGLFGLILERLFVLFGHGLPLLPKGLRDRFKVGIWMALDVGRASDPVHPQEVRRLCPFWGVFVLPKRLFSVLYLCFLHESAVSGVFWGLSIYFHGCVVLLFLLSSPVLERLFSCRVQPLPLVSENFRNVGQPRIRVASLDCLSVFLNPHEIAGLWALRGIFIFETLDHFGCGRRDFTKSEH